MSQQDNQIQSIFESITKNINEDMDDFAPLKSLCNKYQLQPSHVVLIAVALILLLTVLGVFQHIFITLFGLLYPAYMSFKVTIHLCRQSTILPKKKQKYG